MAQIEQEFIQHYSVKPSLRCDARGRVNIIGEHTDYNDGFVLPVALQFATTVLAKERDDAIIEVVSKQYPGQADRFSIDKKIEQSSLAWANYIRGVVQELLIKGYILKGANLFIDSQVPQGCGLSSSAALEVAIGGVFSSISGLSLSKKDIALIGQSAENNFINCQCGIMDQLVSASAQTAHALMIDCQNLDSELVSIPNELTILVINSNFPRKLADSEYNDRRKACERAAKALGVESLRYADMSMLDEIKERIDSTTYKRARHIITDNQRVLETVNAFKNSDLKAFYKIMADGQRSLEEDFEITVEATEGLVKICMEASDGMAGVRQTGGGFGGAVVCVCETAMVEQISRAVSDQYPQRFGLNADIYACQASDGLQITLLNN